MARERDLTVKRLKILTKVLNCEINSEIVNLTAFFLLVYPIVNTHSQRTMWTVATILSLQYCKGIRRRVRVGVGRGGGDEEAAGAGFVPSTP